MLLNDHPPLLFLHTTQQVSSLRCSTFSHRLIHSTLRSHFFSWFMQHQLQLVFSASTSLTHFFNWSPPIQLQLVFAASTSLTHFFNWSSPIQLQLVFADSTSTATLKFQLCQLVPNDNPSRIFRSSKLYCPNII